VIRALPGWALRTLDLPTEAGKTARDMDALHATLISVTFAGTLVVALMTFYYIVRYRRKREFETTRSLVASGKREFIQAGLLLSMFLAFWAWGYAQYLHIETPPDHAMVVYVSAKQWMWKFSYDDGQTSNDTLYVPEHQKVRLVMTSRDVIHSFFAPSFRVKQDVIPGRWVNIWLDAAEPGVYPLYCAEFCGAGHSTMLGQIHVLTAEEWAKWRRGANPATPVVARVPAWWHATCLRLHAATARGADR